MHEICVLIIEGSVMQEKRRPAICPVGHSFFRGALPHHPVSDFAPN